MLCSFLIDLLKLFSSPPAPDRPRLPPSRIEISIEEQLAIATVCYPIRLYYPGQVEYQGRAWSAMCCEDVVLKENDLVRVIGKVDLVLIVEPLDSLRHDLN